MSETKHLFVLRHAKSSWDDPGLDDHSRPLAPRGQRAVAVLADHLKSHDIHPEQVLCSTARRTRETMQGIGVGGEQLVEHELYGASSQELLARLTQVPDEIQSVMIIGHNPAMQTLVLRLTSPALSEDGSALADVQAKFPTGALATLTFEGSWSRLTSGSARLEAFVRPRALARR
jgi:phosphohistidine phosphatase